MKLPVIQGVTLSLCLCASLIQTPCRTGYAELQAAKHSKDLQRHEGVSPQLNLKTLYDTHQWFKLRDVVQTTNASAFYRGVVEYAFNDFKPAEKHLAEVINPRRNPRRRLRRAAAAEFADVIREGGKKYRSEYAA
jgi:hypothetical protein